ncbi:Y2902-like protein [Mya arenaria]|uniref:Y2902-like protein n=1 Tax=Mya arenaria TaxID=6604 RepID=A0ABY7FL24_MYAAR|nr:Y2902-like protein [Mya arenaria]
MPVIQELWEKVTPKLSDVSQENPKNAAVYLSKKYGKISIVGVKHVADRLIDSIRDVIKLASDEFAKEKQWTREYVTALQQIQTRMLLAEEFPTKMEEAFPDIKVEINIGKNEIIIKGNHEDSENVRIFSKDDAHEFEISGSKDGMEQAKTQVEARLRKVNKKEHEIRKPGLGMYMQTETGSEIVRSVESTFPCVISINDDSDDDDYMGSDICVIASFTGYDNRRMFAAVGDMSELNVEVIVNPSDDKIGLSGGLGNVIKMKGGLALERPCKGYIKNNDQLSEGEVFVSPAGNLKAKHIIHVVGPAWKDGTHQEDEKLTEVVFKAMKQASMKHMKSLAMPAISCGVYRFPVKKATDIIVAAVKNFFREEQDSSLTEIYLCDKKDGTVYAFTEALQKE